MQALYPGTLSSSRQLLAGETTELCGFTLSRLRPPQPTRKTTGAADALTQHFVRDLIHANRVPVEFRI